jgi:hypothetical protein
MFKNIWEWVLVQCKQITPPELILAELMEAEVQLLKAETLREYAESQVSYNKTRVKRLKAYVVASTTEEVKEAA